VTIGQLAPASPPTICGAVTAFDRAQPTVTSGNPYVVPGAGTITSWSHSAGSGAGQMLTMKVFRKVADPATYMAVGHDGPRLLASGSLNGFPASLPVKAGDVLGLGGASPSNYACLFDAPGDSYVFRPGDLADGGDPEAFLTDTDGFRVNVSAVFVYSNSFSFGKSVLNKKSGTATLTVGVPNPGELALSGKGVKPAGAAGALVATKVATAGVVKLLIKAKGRKRRKLNETGKVKVKPKVTYTPTGGDPRTQSTKVKLKKR
jgi:hypothetical protein